MKKVGILFAGLLLVSCNSNEWNEENSLKVESKCNEEENDCNCYVEVTKKHFKTPEEYNKAISDEDGNKEVLAKYRSDLTSCSTLEWTDEEQIMLMENPPEGIDGDMYSEAARTTFKNKAEFDMVTQNPDQHPEKMKEFNSKLQ